jgi:glycosyltransferase involved in cell wall biosynthesis
MALAWLGRSTSVFATFPARVLNRFLVWFLASGDPTIVGVREFIHCNPILLGGARAFVRAIYGLAALPRWLATLKLSAAERQHPILAARATGGTISIAELEQIRNLARKRPRRVLYIAEGPERDQIEIMLEAARLRATRYQPRLSTSGTDLDPDDFDLIIAAPVPGLERQVVAMQEKYRRPERFLLVGGGLGRSEYFRLKADPPGSRKFLSRRKLIEMKLASDEPLSVIFLNDIGFQYGAGIALKRQVTSLLLKNWDVSVVAWSSGEKVDHPTFATGIAHFDNWHGIHDVRNVHANKGANANGFVPALNNANGFVPALNKVRAFNPDVVIAGNLHGAGWSPSVLRGLKSLGTCVVAYMHDTYLVTGRCAYPLSCTLFRTGCNASCPTPHQYPQLAPEKIAEAWRERGITFTGPERIPLVANSLWTRNIAVQRFGGAADIEVVHLGLDHELFAPLAKSVVRRLLGIPDDKAIVAMGAVDVHDQWKGGPLFHELLKALADRNDLHVVLFGQSSEKLPCRKAFGLVRDERLMPLILNAADMYVSTATAEAFGQSLLEASACAVPVVALDVGGVSDVIVNDKTGVLVRRQTVTDLLIAIERLLAKPGERQAMGWNGRRRVEEGFTLVHQADAWVDYIKRLCYQH